jgi:hypothetical protein
MGSEVREKLSMCESMDERFEKHVPSSHLVLERERGLVDIVMPV